MAIPGFIASGCCGFAAVPPAQGWAGYEQRGEDYCDLERVADSLLDSPPVVDGSGDGRDVGEAVEAVPVPASELADGPGGGGQRQRDHQRPGGEPGHDEAALADVVDHGGEAESGVERDVGHEVQAAVEEGPEAEHAAEADDPGQPGDEAADGRDGQRRHEQAEGSLAGEEGYSVG